MRKGSANLFPRQRTEVRDDFGGSPTDGFWMHWPMSARGWDMHGRDSHQLIVATVMAEPSHPNSLKLNFPNGTPPAA